MVIWEFGLAISDMLGVTAQGLETIHHNSNDKIVLKRIEELCERYEISTFVVGMPINMNGTVGERADITKKFIHKLKCKFNNINVEIVDERLTTVAAHKTMNFLDVNPKEKKGIVDTISAVYILEIYLNKQK